MTHANAPWAHTLVQACTPLVARSVGVATHPLVHTAFHTDLQMPQESNHMGLGTASFVRTAEQYEELPVGRFA